MAYSSLYTTGTVSISSGGTVVTGTGTDWVAARVLPGALLFVSGQSRPLAVESVTAATSLTLSEPSPAAASGAAYSLVRLGLDGKLVDILSTLLQQQSTAFDLSGVDQSVTLTSDSGDLWLAFETATGADVNKWRIGVSGGDFDAFVIQAREGGAWVDALTIDRATGALSGAGVASISASAVSTVRGGVATEGDTLAKLLALIEAIVSLEDNAVTTAKIASGAVTTAKVADGAITTAKHAANSVTPAKSLHGAWATVASAGTVDLGAQAGRNLVISGTTTITSFGTTGAADYIPFVVRFSGILTLTHGSNLILPTGANITTAANDTAIVVWEGAGVWRVIAYQRADGTALAAAAAGGLPAGYLTGLGLTYASATSYTVATGTACSEDGSAKTMTLTSALTKTLGAFAVGSGNGGLSTGTIAPNTWYNVHLVQRVSDGLVDAILDTSLTAPTMPTAGGTWTARRCIGSVMTNGSSQLVQWVQHDDYFMLATPSLDVTALALSTARSTLTLKVPTGRSLRAICRFSNSGSSGTLVVLQSLDETDAAPSATAAPLADAIVAPSTGLLAGRVEVFTNTSGQIAARASASGNTFYLSTLGWVDTRGK